MHRLARWLMPSSGQKLRHAWHLVDGWMYSACGTLPPIPGAEANGRDSPTPAILSPEHCLHCGALCSIPRSKKQ